MVLFVNLFFLIVSSVLYISAPDIYSYNYCVLINVLFIIQNCIYFTFRRTKSLVGFQFIFMISFYFTNFVYPVFYFPTNKDFLLFHFSFNENIISKATSIAFLAYSFYIFSLSFFSRKIQMDNPDFFKKIDFEKVMKLLLKITVIFLIMFIIYGGYDYFSSIYSKDGDVFVGGISLYFYIVFFTTLHLMAIFVFDISERAKRFYYLVTIFSIIIFFLFLGSRNMALAVFLILILSYNNNVRKIPNFVFLSVLILGAIFLTILMFTRSISLSDTDYVNSGIENLQFNSLWDIGSDLIVCNRSLYTLIDFANNNTHTFGVTMLGGFLSPIPFAQSLVCKIFAIPLDFIGSASFGTFLEFGKDSTLGLGTNIVADVYLAFGLLGIVVFFMFLGWLVGRAESQYKTNVYWNIIYYFLISNSVFFVRSGFFDNIRPLIWALVFMFLINKKYSLQKKWTL